MTLNKISTCQENGRLFITKLSSAILMRTHYKEPFPPSTGAYKKNL